MRKGLLALAVVGAVVLALVGLFAFTSRSSTPKELRYRGSMYSGVVQIDRYEATQRLGRLRPGGAKIFGRPVVVTGGNPPRFVLVRRSDSRFDVYGLMIMR